MTAIAQRLFTANKINFRQKQLDVLVCIERKLTQSTGNANKSTGIDSTEERDTSKHGITVPV